MTSPPEDQVRLLVEPFERIVSEDSASEGQRRLAVIFGEIVVAKPRQLGQSDRALETQHLSDGVDRLIATRLERLEDAHIELG